MAEAELPGLAQSVAPGSGAVHQFSDSGAPSATVLLSSEAVFASCKTCRLLA